MSGNALTLSSVSKRYGRHGVLDDVSRSFGPGVTVITGPSGVGKSTLLRLCASVETPTSGSVLWRGQPVSKQRRAFRRGLGYAPQRIDFPEDVTGLDFLLHVGALKGLGVKGTRKQGAALLDRVGLRSDARRRIATYSGGMRRRLGVAQAFLGAPDILVLDEPTAELDVETAGHVNDLILKAGERAVVLMTTHLDSALAGRVHERFALQRQAVPAA